MRHDGGINKCSNAKPSGLSSDSVSKNESTRKEPVLGMKGENLCLSTVGGMYLSSKLLLFKDLFKFLL